MPPSPKDPIDFGLRDPGAPPPAGIARSAGLVGTATALSRLLGLLRELVVARVFGAGMAMDAFNVAFRIPNLLRDLFAEGALSAAFVPAFTRVLTQRGKPSAFRLADRLSGSLALVIGILCLGGMAASDLIVGWMAPGFASVPGKIELTVLLTRIMMFFLLLVALAAMTMGMLNSLGRFFLPALAPSCLSLGIIAGAVLIGPLMPAYGLDPTVALALGVMLGGACQLLAQVPPLWREGWRPRPRLAFRDPDVAGIGRLMLPAIVGLAATQFSVFMNTWMASQLVQGSVSWLIYAFRLAQLPIGMFGVAIGLAAQPHVSRLLAQGRRDEVKESVSHALSLVLLLNLPASAGLMVLSEPICRLLFQGGSFSAADTIATACALEAYCAGLFAYSAVKVVVPVFYALGNSAAPTAISIFSVLLGVVFNLWSMHVLGHAGLALGTSLAVLTNFALLMAALRRELGPLPSTLTSTLRISVATLAMGLTCRAAHVATDSWLGHASLIPRIGGVALPIAAGLAVLACILWIAGSPEMRELTAALRRRLRSA